MAIDKLNHHYSLTNPASIYDEEALTALELAGRTTAKVNETVDAFNALDQSFTKLKEKEVPEKIESSMEEKIADGTFNQMISRYAGDLEDRVDNLLGSVKEGSTTLDAEVIDVRVGADGKEHTNAGSAVRAQFLSSAKMIAASPVFEIGNIEASTGANTKAAYDLDYRFRSNFLSVENVIGFRINNTHNFAIFEYDENMGYLGRAKDRWLCSIFKKDLRPETRYIRILIQEWNSTAATSTMYDHGFEMITTATIVNDHVMNLFEVKPHWVRGTYTADKGKFSARTNRICTIEYYPVNIINAVVDNHLTHHLCGAYYDDHFQFISTSDFGRTFPFELIPENAVYVKFILKNYPETDISAAEAQTAGVRIWIEGDSLDKVYRKITENSCPDFMYDQLNIAYSSLYGSTVINTEAHFKTVAEMGFDALKGDVRISSDGHLIMSHDAGYTEVSANAFGAFNSSNYIPWNTVTWEKIQTLENRMTPSESHPVIDFETYIKICKFYGKIAYITLREHDIAATVMNVINTLKKYKMVNRCIINSFTYETLAEVRKYTDVIPLSQVFNLGDALTVDNVLSVAGLGNGIVTLFNYPGEGESILNQSQTAVSYARQYGVFIHAAQISTATQWKAMFNQGVTGMQITKPILEEVSTWAI